MNRIKAPQTSMSLINGSVAALQEEAKQWDREAPGNTSEIDSDPVALRAYPDLCRLFGMPSDLPSEKRTAFVNSLVSMTESHHNVRCGNTEPAKWKPWYPLNRKARRAVAAVMRKAQRAEETKDRATRRRVRRVVKKIRQFEELGLLDEVAA